MRKIAGVLVSVAMIIGLGLSVAQAETVTYSVDVYRVADTPSKYGFKGLYTLYSADTYQKGGFGVGLYWDMTRFCLPGDPRYPELQEYSLVAGYGITDRLELGVSAPFRVLKVPAASAESRWPDDIALKDVDESGFSNVSVGLRYNVMRGGALELTPYVQAFLPTASDPEAGTGADNTRIHLGVSAGMPIGIARFYSQVAYQIATEYDQDRKNFSERTPLVANSRPRFERFGTNPLFHEYGNTLFYGAGFAVPIVEDTAEFFTEFQFYHSFEDEDYIPLFEDYNTAGNYEALDVVQDGGMANIGAKIGFGNGLTFTGGWGGILFAEEPMYESATWRAFAGLTYASPHIAEYVVQLPDIPMEQGPGQLAPPGPPTSVQPVEVITQPRVDCDDLLRIMVFFEFDRSTLTPEAQQALDNAGRLLRLCQDYSLEVQGHTDWEGTENYNMTLGARRARAAVYYLVFDQGIDPDRVVVNEKLVRTPQLIAGETYGESIPIVSNESDAGRAQNRRVQFVKMGM